MHKFRLYIRITINMKLVEILVIKANRDKKLVRILNILTNVEVLNLIVTTLRFPTFLRRKRETSTFMYCADILKS